LITNKEVEMGCENIPEIKYSEFSKKFHNQGAENRIPIVGMIDITARCNLKCVHCYIRNTSSFGDELTYQEICNIFDQLAEEGCLWLCITGGEPLVRPDFYDIYSYAKQKGFLITLFSNGTLLTPPVVEFLTEQPPFVLDISLYGMTAETYEKVTGIPGSFSRCINGIELALAHHLPVKLKMVVLTINQHELYDFMQYADKLGVTFRYDPKINPKIDGSMEPLNYRLSPEEIVSLERANKRLFQALCEDCDRLWGNEGSDNLYVCGAGVNSFHISSDGKLNLCVISHQPGYDLRQGTFHEGFHDIIPKVRAQKRTRYSECQSCPMINICGQCPSWAELEHGDPEAKVDFLCQTAHLRTAAFKTGYAEVAKT
jgi:radical SAM protein with 4Fe4S-binding SPASM domain